MIDPALSKKCFVILTNEIVPRAKNLGIPIKEFLDSEVSGLLARLEYEGIMTRKEVRSLLDERVKVIQNENQQ